MSFEDVHYDQPRRIQQFWNWWHDLGAAVAEEALSGNAEATDELSRRAQDLHEHLLAVPYGSPEGLLHLALSARASRYGRSIIARWLNAAPADTPWRFAPCPLPGLDYEGQIEIHGLAIELRHTRFNVAFLMDEMRVALAISHPDLARFDPETVERFVAPSLMLNVISQDEYERWVDALKLHVVEPKQDTLTGRELRHIFDDLSAPDVSSTPLEGVAGQQFMYRPALRWVDHAALDMGLTVRVPFELAPRVLHHIEQSTAGSGVVMAVWENAWSHHEESRKRICRLHYYADSLREEECLAFVNLVRNNPVTPDVDVEFNFDPGWDRVSRIVGHRL